MYYAVSQPDNALKKDARLPENVWYALEAVTKQAGEKVNPLAALRKGHEPFMEIAMAIAGGLRYLDQLPLLPPKRAEAIHILTYEAKKAAELWFEKVKILADIAKTDAKEAKDTDTLQEIEQGTARLKTAYENLLHAIELAEKETWERIELPNWSSNVTTVS